MQELFIILAKCFGKIFYEHLIWKLNLTYFVVLIVNFITSVGRKHKGCKHIVPARVKYFEFSWFNRLFEKFNINGMSGFTIVEIRYVKGPFSLRKLCTPITKIDFVLTLLSALSLLYSYFNSVLSSFQGLVVIQYLSSKMYYLVRNRSSIEFFW